MSGNAMDYAVGPSEPDEQLGELVQFCRVRCAWATEMAHPEDCEATVEGSEGVAKKLLLRAGWRETQHDGWLCPSCMKLLEGQL